MREGLEIVISDLIKPLKIFLAVPYCSHMKTNSSVPRGKATSCAMLPLRPSNYKNEKLQRITK